MECPRRVQPADPEQDGSTATLTGRQLPRRQHLLGAPSRKHPWASGAFHPRVRPPLEMLSERELGMQDP